MAFADWAQERMSGELDDWEEVEVRPNLEECIAQQAEFVAGCEKQGDLDAPIDWEAVYEKSLFRRSAPDEEVGAPHTPRGVYCALLVWPNIQVDSDQSE